MPTSITIAQAIRGALAPIDLLTSEGTILFSLDAAGLQINGSLFRVEDDEFIFRLGVFDSRIAVQRDNILITLTPEPLPDANKRVVVFILWNHTELTLKVGDKETKVQTHPTAPSTRLLQFARQQNFIQVKEYPSEEEFRSKVYSCLLDTLDKIHGTGSITGFWNVEYDGHRIKARKPKREPEIHPLIHCILFDQMLLAGIDVMPEQQTGVGNLDFLFLASVKDLGNRRFCAEFKHAHSDQIFHGLEIQLPAYMRSTGATYGAYCVLSFKGEWFDEPSMSTHDLEFQLQLRKLRSKDPLLENIRVLTFDLSKPPSASTL